MKTEITSPEIAMYDAVATAVASRTGPKLEFLSRRVTELNGLTGHPDAFTHFEWAGHQRHEPANRVAMKNILAAALAEPKTDAERVARATAMKEFCQLIKDARAGVAGKAEEYAAIRQETVDLYVRAKSDFAALFFEPRSLAPDDQVYYTHTYRMPVNVRYTADGGNRTQKLVKAQSNVPVRLRELWTDSIEYELRDINVGFNIAAIAQATVDLSWDLAAKIDNLAFAFMADLFGPFTTGFSGLYMANSNIVTANLPTTNDIVLSGNTATSLFRKAVIKAIMLYCQSWGEIWGSPIRPTGVILIPSLDSTDLSEEFSPTGSTANSTADAIIRNYARFEWFDTMWTLVPTATLTPGVCYAVLNGAVGQMFTKPAFDMDYVKTDVKNNWEERAQMKTLGMASKQPDRRFALRIRYRNAA